MAEAEWLACTDPTPMLEFLRGKASDRKLRLFACACVRGIWRLLDDQRSKRAVTLAEEYAEGVATSKALDRARSEAIELANLLCAPPGHSRAERRKLGAYAAGRTAAHGWDAMISAAEFVLPGRKSVLIRCIFGNPFRPSPTLLAAVLAWNDGTVPRIARGIHDDRKMPEGTLYNDRLAILADALLDAGCEDEALMQHCRKSGPHVRGCWAVDLILGKS